MGNRKKRTSRKLSLTKETIRALNASDLGAAAGGGSNAAATCGCFQSPSLVTCVAGDPTTGTMVTAICGKG